VSGALSVRDARKWLGKAPHIDSVDTATTPNPIPTSRAWHRSRTASGTWS